MTQKRSGQYALCLAALLCLIPTITEASICSRTEQVRNAIIAKVADKTDCAEITDTDLAGITGTLALGSKSIASLKATDFDGLTGLSELKLERNSLGSLPVGVFDELGSLSRLNLYDNGLTSLPEDIFDELAALTLLNLGGNKLGSLPAGVFDQLTRLQVLGLHENRGLAASSLDGAFDQLTALIALRLSNNKFSSLPAGVFDQLNNLNRLVLSGNNLSSLPTGIFDQLTALIVLRLSNNKFSSLPEDVFARLSSLGMLTLDNNTLVALPWHVFSRLYNLGHLDLSGNRGLRCLPLLPAKLFNLVLDKDKSAYAACDTAMLIASDVTVTTAKLTLTNWSQAWSYKGNHVSCTNVAAGTSEANLSGLRVAWEYLIYAYPEADCPANSSPHWLDSVIFTTLRSKVEGVNVTAGSASLLVDWTAQSESVGSVGYHVQWKSGTQDWSSERQSDVSTNAATISGLTGGRSYTVRVRSYHTGYLGRVKLGAWSDPVTGTPGTGTAAVTLTASSVTHNSATLTITGHTAAWWYRRTAPGGDDTCHSVTANDANEDLSSLSGNTDYTYKAYSDSSCSTELATAAAFLTKPGKPTKPVATASAGSGKLTLSASVTGDGTLTGWQYQQKEGSGNFDDDWTDISSTSASLSHSITGLTDGTDYQFKVRAVNATGSGAESDASAAVQPAAPALTVSSLGATSATLTLSSWTPAWWHSKTAGPGPARCTPVSQGTHTADLSGLTAGSDYTWAVFSAAGCSASDKIAEVNFSTPALDATNARAWLARFGRTVAGQIVDAVTQRLAGRWDSGTQVTLGGQALELAPASEGSAPAHQEDGLHDPWTEVRDWHTQAWPRALRAEPQGLETDTGRMTVRDFLLASSFHVASGDEAVGPALAAWGRVDTSHFDGRDDGLSLDGEVTTATLGADFESGPWLAGVALAHSSGDGSFSSSDGDGAAGRAGTDGDVETRLTSLYPYARYTLDARRSVWGLLGYGEGTLDLQEDGTEVETDLRMRMAALGARSVLTDAAPEGGLELALKADALWVRTDSRRDARLHRAEADTSRLRVLLDGIRRSSFGEASLEQQLELGVRLDGGDAETGTGLEAGAGLRYAVGRIRVEGTVRTLLAHAESGYEEWGAGLAVDIEPDVHKRGLALSLASSWGETGSGAEALWAAPGPDIAPGDEPDMSRRLEAQVGYGLAVARVPGVMVPYAGLSLADEGGRDVRAGLRWQILPEVRLSFEGTRREPPGDNAPEHELMLRARVRW